ncbi:cytidine deaminase [Apilactobacillus timberlakei]|uniref:cytidine deaminase family protein n=1 Tax=Apilactobacillus timberlakei TaxID=2008380 RepID=UPI001126AA96|nr:cytidine deaminase [Apilactobacillus timberlakei]TPR23153.1 cytidine deaminase [Apilactobacillus timberlakei]
MSIWETLYQAAKKEYHPEDISPFIYAHNVVSAIESDNGQIFTGFCIESCSGVCNLCAERVAALNMYNNSGQTRIKRIITFRDKPPYGKGSGIPCGACREFFLQLNAKNKDIEIMENYTSMNTVKLSSLMPNWWGEDRYKNKH